MSPAFLSLFPAPAVGLAHLLNEEGFRLSHVSEGNLEAAHFLSVESPISGCVAPSRTCGSVTQGSSVRVGDSHTHSSRSALTPDCGGSSKRGSELNESGCPVLCTSVVTRPLTHTCGPVFSGDGSALAGLWLCCS